VRPLVRVHAATGRACDPLATNAAAAARPLGDEARRKTGGGRAVRAGSVVELTAAAAAGEADGIQVWITACLHVHLLWHFLGTIAFAV
jgi:hypothetical protein